MFRGYLLVYQRITKLGGVALESAALHGIFNAVEAQEAPQRSDFRSIRRYDQRQPPLSVFRGSRELQREHRTVGVPFTGSLQSKTLPAQRAPADANDGRGARARGRSFETRQRLPRGATYDPYWLYFRFPTDESNPAKSI